MSEKALLAAFMAVATIIIAALLCGATQAIAGW